MKKALTKTLLKKFTSAQLAKYSTAYKIIYAELSEQSKSYNETIAHNVACLSAWGHLEPKKQEAKS